PQRTTRPDAVNVLSGVHREVVGSGRGCSGVSRPGACLWFVGRLTPALIPPLQLRNRWSGCAAGLVALLAWGFDYAATIYWGDHIDLEVEFAVTDADSDRPIPGARVEIRSDGGNFGSN